MQRSSRVVTPRHAACRDCKRFPQVLRSKRRADCAPPLIADVGRHYENWALPRLSESWHLLSRRRTVHDTANLAPGNRALRSTQPHVSDRPPPGALCHTGAPAHHPVAQPCRSSLHPVRCCRGCARCRFQHPWLPMTRRPAYGVTPNYALERSVRGLAWGAAGARESLAPAGPGNCCARPAQRGRRASSRLR
jgi:hypothetical protein